MCAIIAVLACFACYGIAKLICNMMCCGDYESNETCGRVTETGISNTNEVKVKFDPRTVENYRLSHGSAWQALVDGKWTDLSYEVKGGRRVLKLGPPSKNSHPWTDPSVIKKLFDYTPEKLVPLPQEPTNSKKQLK